MGRNANGPDTFWPDDTEDCFYIAASTHPTMDEIYSLACDKLRLENDRGCSDWMYMNMQSIQIEAEYIQTKCLTYDLYDHRDYTLFLVITRLK